MLLIYNARIVDCNKDKKCAIEINKNKIKRILSNTEAIQIINEAKKKKGVVIEQGIANGFYSIIKIGNNQFLDAYGNTLMPSFIDMHSHFRDPGFTQKEDIISGCNAAAAGGYGTLVLMPNTNPVVSTQDQALINNSKAINTGVAEVIQSVSITKKFDGTTTEHISSLDSKIIPLISEDGKEVTDSSVMYKAMKIAAQKKLIVSCHCEDPFLAQAARPLRTTALKQLNDGNKKQAIQNLTQANHLLALAEDCSTIRNIDLAKEAKCHLHLCHVSTSVSMEAVRNAKKAGMNITCEVTPHHLALEGTKSPNIFNIVNPPLRSESDCQSLINALRDGTADVIATDHAPHTPQDKLNGSPGFTGLETSFAVCNTVLVKKNKFTLKKLSSLLSARPAEILQLKKKGLIEEGYDADIVLVDPNKEWTVKNVLFKSKGKYTPFENKKLTGKVLLTIKQGITVYSI